MLSLDHSVMRNMVDARIQSKMLHTAVINHSTPPDEALHGNQDAYHYCHRAISCSTRPESRQAGNK